MTHKQPKPCQFCHSKHAAVVSVRGTKEFTVECTKCGASGPKRVRERTAVDAWNGKKPKRSKKK